MRQSLILVLSLGFVGWSHSVLSNPSREFCSGFLSSFSPELREAQQLLHELKSLNDFSRLQLGREASQDEIQIAFRNLARQYHPDRVAHRQNSKLTQLYNDIFKLIHESYERLIAGKGRSFGAEAVSETRSKKNFDTKEIAAQKEKIRAEFLEIFNVWSKDGFGDSLIEAILQFFRTEVSRNASDQRLLHLARRQMLEETIPFLIRNAKTFNELYVIHKLLTSLDSLTDFLPATQLAFWKSSLWKKSLQTEPDRSSNFISAMSLQGRGIGEMDFSGLLFSDIESMLQRFSAVSGKPKSDIAWDAVEKLAHRRDLDPVWRLETSFYLIDFALEEPSLHRLEAVRALILKHPQKTRMHQTLMERLNRKVRNNDELRSKLSQVFDTGFLMKHRFEISSLSHLISLVRGSPMQRKIEERSLEEDLQSDSSELLLKKGTDGPFQMRFGDIVITIPIDEVRRVTQMSLSQAQIYLNKKYGIKVLEIKRYGIGVSTPQELLFYHDKMAREDMEAVFLPAGLENHPMATYRDHPVIAVRSDSLESLPHEFVHFLTYSAVEAAAKERGIPHPMTETLNRLNALHEIRIQRSSSLWSAWDQVKAYGQFKAEDIQLFKEILIGEAQWAFQRLRDEQLSDRAHLAAAIDQPALRARRLRHYSLELERFNETLQTIEWDALKRMMKHHDYLEQSEAQALFDLLLEMAKLRKTVREKLDDPLYEGPQELLHKTNTKSESKHLPSRHP